MILKYFRFFLKNYFFTLIAITFTILYWNSASKLPAGALRYPTIITFLVVILAVWNLVLSVVEFRKVYRTEGDDESKYGNPFNLTKDRVVVMISTVAYGILAPIVGFFLTTFIYLSGICYYLGVRRPLRVIVYALVVTAFLVLVFKVWLGVRTPNGLLI